MLKLFKNLTIALLAMIPLLNAAAATNYPIIVNGHPLTIGSSGSLNVTAFGANPMGLAYSNVTGNSAYNHPTGVLITGRGNLYDTSFQTARAAGAEVYAYFDLMEAPDCAFDVPADCSNNYDNLFYAGVTYWPTLTQGHNSFTAAGQHRINATGDHMTDITVNSASVNAMLAYIEAVAASGLFDGVFLDVLGGRTYTVSSSGLPGADWGLLTDSCGASNCDWTQTEMNSWTAGAIDIVNRLNQWRITHNQAFIIVNNNTWDNTIGNGQTGENYVNGICLEHHDDAQASAIATAAKTFRGDRRRVLVIATSTAQAAVWATKPGVTHVSDETSYSVASPPPIPFVGIIPR